MNPTIETSGDPVAIMVQLKSFGTKSDWEEISQEKVGIVDQAFAEVIQKMEPINHDNFKKVVDWYQSLKHPKAKEFGRACEGFFLEHLWALMQKEQKELMWGRDDYFQLHAEELREAGISPIALIDSIGSEMLGKLQVHSLRASLASRGFQIN